MGIAVYFYRQMDREIRQHVLARLGDHYPGLVVTIRDARVIDGEGIELRGVKIAEPGREGTAADLVSIDAIVLDCPTGLPELLQGDVRIRRVIFRRPTVRAERRLDGTWSVDRLWPLPRFGGHSPPATIEDGTVVFVDPARSPHGTFTLRSINLEIVPREATGDGIDRAKASPQAGRGGPAENHDERFARFRQASREIARRLVASGFLAADWVPAELSQAVQEFAEQPAAAAAPVADPGPCPLLAVKGTAASDHFPRLEFEGELDPNDGRWHAEGALVGLALSPELRLALPAELAQKVAPLDGLRGKARLEFSASRRDKEGPVVFAVRGRLEDGRVHDARLPYPVADLVADFSCDNGGVRIDDLAATCGDASVRLSLRSSGYAEGSPLALTAQIRRLRLDPKLRGFLTPTLVAAWDAYSPSGVIDADVQLAYDGSAWHPDVELRCLDVAFSYYRIPYRLEGANGAIRLEGNLLTARLRAFAGAQGVRIAARFADPGTDMIGHVELETEGPIPLDEKLIAALDGRTQQVVRSLSPRGRVTIAGRFERRDARGESLQRKLLIAVTDGSVRYEKFPYPIAAIKGTMEMIDGRWSFRDFEGRNDGTLVTCEGSWDTVHDDGELALNFVAADVLLKDELRDALNAGPRKVWSDLRIQGTVDYLAAGVRYRPMDGRFTLDVLLQKWPRQQNVEGRSITINPAWFPYRLDELTGAVRIRDGHIEMEGLRAVHGNTRVALDGDCDVAGDGNWRVRLKRLTADRLQANHELIAALPPGLRDGVARLNLSGLVNMQGGLELASAGRADSPIQAGWDLNFAGENVAVECGIRLENVFGSVRLMGRSDAEAFASDGELALDSLVYEKVQFTRVAGPFRIDNAQVAFGAWAHWNDARRGPRPVTGEIFGGKVQGDAQVLLSGDYPFALQAVLSDGSLQKVSQEMSSQARNIQGRVNGNLRLEGSSKGTHTLRGEGMVRLRDAYIYELPIMVALLKILRVKQPDRTAFTTSDIDFRMRGEHLYFDRIDFNGDAVSLKGNGEMSLERVVKLNFYTLVGRDDIYVPILRPLLGEASRQVLLIRVTGPLDNPRTTREAFPALNETLQQLFPETARSGAGSQPAAATPR